MYSGPAILSRGQTPAAQATTPVSFRPYIGLGAAYDTGLEPVSVASNGQVPTTNEYGLDLNLGAYVYHVWRHTRLGLDYRGDFRHYSTSSLDGTDQSLALVLTHELTRRITFTLQAQSGIYSLNNYLASLPQGIVTPNYLELPQNDIFDSRTIFATASGDLTYHFSPRLSFNAGLSGNLVRRQSTALYGTTGAIARADLEYQISWRTTVGVDYSFTYFGYTRGFGNSEMQSVGVNYSAKISRNVQLSARIGAARAASTSRNEVILAPAVAALVGETVGIQSAHALTYSPAVQVQLARAFRRSEFSMSYADQIMPGNGVYTASHSNGGGAAFNYSGVHYWNFSLNGMYSRMTSLVQTLGAYTNYGGGIGITRELGKGFHNVLRFDAFHNDIAGPALFRRTEFRASMGVTFSPGDRPLVLW